MIISDASLTVLQRHVEQHEHVFLVCRGVDPKTVLEELRCLDPTHVFEEGTMTFDGGAFIFVRANMSDKAISVIAKTSGQLNIYVL